MAYNTQDLKNSAPGQTQETSDGGSPKAGVYKHPQAVDENGEPRRIVAVYDPLFGNVQAEAFVRLGFEFERDATDADYKTIVGDAKAAREFTQGLNAPSDRTRLDALELESLRKFKAEKEAEEALKNASKTQKDGDKFIAGVVGQAEQNRPADPLDESAKVAQDNAADAIIARNEEATTTAPEVAPQDDSTPEKALSKQNSTELKATAEAEGVEITEELDANKKLAAAIQAKRDEKESEK